jgi:hypothetical protein
MLIDEFMPHYSLHQVDHVAVKAYPHVAWAAVREVDMYRIRWARALFQLRTMSWSLPPTARIDDIVKDSGFQVLAEGESEVVVGSIGKFWERNIEFASVTPADFATFADPGFGKLAWCLRVDPRQGGGSWITVDLRVSATDENSLARFRRYWGLIGRFSHAIRHALLKQYRDELGPAAPDGRRHLPGDELLASADGERTHSVTIEAPPAEVWPWLAQIGCQRAGYYSIDWLDNAGSPSADRIIPELQHLEVGDVIPWRPTGKEGFSVRRIEAERVLVLGGTSPAYEMTWAFVLEPIGPTATRLIVRVRGTLAHEHPIRARVLATAALAAHEVMERAQLAGIKRRAETR